MALTYIQPFQILYTYNNHPNSIYPMQSHLRIGGLDPIPPSLSKGKERPGRVANSMGLTYRAIQTFIIPNICFWMVVGKWRTQKETIQTQGEHAIFPQRGPDMGIKPFLLYSNSANHYTTCANLQKNCQEGNLQVTSSYCTELLYIS